jgi:hypothetical protein
MRVLRLKRRALVRGAVLLGAVGSARAEAEMAMLPFANGERPVVRYPR